MPSGNDQSLLLDLFYEAEQRYQSLHAQVAIWRDPDYLLSNSPEGCGAQRRSIRGHSADFVLTTAGRLEGLPSTVSEELSQRRDIVTELWLSPGPRRRFHTRWKDARGNHSESRALKLGDYCFFERGSRLGRSNHTSGVPLTLNVEFMIAPSRLLSTYKFRILEEDTILHRPTYLVSAVRRVGTPPMGPPWYALGIGDQHILSVDAEFGVLLATRTYQSGELTLTNTMTEIDYTESLDPALFSPPSDDPLNLASTSESSRANASS